ncbi:MAG: hypothetical protein E6Q97_18600 [Desulfurellales bacterium]|nr:MAG: hypothetical protein E6Q97_18600 [Desulfurellales bacterium]
MTWQVVADIVFLFTVVFGALLIYSAIRVRGAEEEKSSYALGVKSGLAEGVKTCAAVLRKQAIKLEASDNATAATIYRAAARHVEETLL